MASYGALIRSVTTAEINRVQREGNYERWAYFVDETSGQTGALFANRSMFAAYTVTDTPDPRLVTFGQEPIKNLTLTPDPEALVLTAGSNELCATVFTDPSLIFEDEFSPNLTFALVDDWQRYLRACGVRMAADPRQSRRLQLIVGGIVAVIVFLLVILFF